MTNIFYIMPVLILSACSSTQPREEYVLWEIPDEYELVTADLSCFEQAAKERGEKISNMTPWPVACLKPAGTWAAHQARENFDKCFLDRFVRDQETKFRATEMCLVEQDRDYYRLMEYHKSELEWRKGKKPVEITGQE